MINELSIIICTLNEEKYLAGLLNSIIAQEFDGALEVIIVDGESEDKTLEVAKKYFKPIRNLKLFSTEKGISRQRNFGVKKASYNNLFFVDADMMLPKNYLKRMQTIINPDKPSLDITAMTVSQRNIFDYLTMAIAYPIIFMIGFLDSVTLGGCLFSTKEIHNKINGFDETLFILEDHDYGVRAIKTGFKHHFRFSPMIYHSPRRLREMGRMNFLASMLKLYIEIGRHGHTHVNKTYKYPTGHYKEFHR